MTIKIILVTFLCVASVSAGGCCRGFKILQFRRPNCLPLYEPTCEFEEPEHFCESSLYPIEACAPPPIPRFFPPYIDPKPVPHKCGCNKPPPPPRMMTNIQRYYKKNYCSEAIMDDLALRHAQPCAQYPCGQFNDCPPYNPCAACPPFPPCGLPSPVFRPPPHRMLPLTLPTSCVC